MSGLCGICEPGARIEPGPLERMLGALALPGEGGGKRLSAHGLNLGLMARWPRQQAASVPDVRIVADVELLNQRELAEALGVAPLSAAEVLAWSYLRYGLGFVEKLDGVFSFALWDEKQRRLVLATDRMGIHAWWWQQTGDRLLFASRAGAVAAGADFAPAVNQEALVQFLLFSVVPAPLSIYAGVQRLRPGHLLIYENGQARQQCYWDVRYEEGEDRDVHRWATRVREGMRAAVHRTLQGLEGEHTGAYLSGGTDSSSVVAFMSERHQPVNTFSISFAEERYDEGGFARITADRFRTRHSQKTLSPQDAFDAIPKVLAYYDEPFGNSSAIGAYYCARLAQEAGVGTLLAGDGGDELFAGNQRYADDKRFALYHSLPAALRHRVVEPLVRLLPQDGWLSLPARYVRRASIPNPLRIHSYNFFLSNPPKTVFDDGFLAAVPPAASWFQYADEHFHGALASSELNRWLYMDLKMTLADNDLRKVAGTAELAGIEVRFPLLDQRLVELSGCVPTELKLKGFEKRYIFKQAMKGILPDQVLYKKKHGFGVPLGVWFLRDSRLEALVDDVLFDRRTEQRGYFQPGFLKQLRQMHRQGYAPYYGEIVWYLLVLELWHRQHLESRSEVAIGR